MKPVNTMSFVRQCEPRSEPADKILFETARKQLALENGDVTCENNVIAVKDTDNYLIPERR